MKAVALVLLRRGTGGVEQRPPGRRGGQPPARGDRCARLASAVEVENALCEHPAVSEAVVVGLPDQFWGQVVAAAVLPAPGAQVDESELLSFTGRRLAQYKLPSRVLVLPEFPRNATGKARRPEIRAAFL